MLLFAEIPAGGRHLFTWNSGVRNGLYVQHVLAGPTKCRKVGSTTAKILLTYKTSSPHQLRNCSRVRSTTPSRPCIWHFLATAVPLVSTDAGIGF